MGSASPRRNNRAVRALSRVAAGLRSSPWPRVALLPLVLVTIFPGPAQARERLDIDLFARVGDPGQPEGIAIDSRGSVFVGTSPKEGGPIGRRRPSKVFAFRPDGTLLREYVVRGQDLDEPFYGLVGMAFDGDDLLYALDAAPPRVLRLNPQTGAQREYTRFRDVPPCRVARRTHDCSDTVGDMGPFPDYPVFAPDGTMYITDLMQALIWRVPPGGGKPEVWFTDSGLETLFGPNGIQFRADGRTLLVVLSTQSIPAAANQRTPGLYELPVRPDGGPGRLRQFWEAGPLDVPDGFALARSGNVYVALGANAIALVSPSGDEIERRPRNELENQQMEVPFDQPASAAFLGERVLVTNHALFSRNPDRYAVLDVFAGEPGLPLFRPRLGRSSGGGDTSSDGEPVDDRGQRRERSDGVPNRSRETSEPAGADAPVTAEGEDQATLPLTGLHLALALIAGAGLLSGGIALRSATRRRGRDEFPRGP